MKLRLVLTCLAVLLFTSGAEARGHHHHRHHHRTHHVHRAKAKAGRPQVQAVAPKQEEPCFFLGCLSKLAEAPAAIVSGGTAVYNIVAHTLTLPSGTTLEAHSGLGRAIDDPRYASIRMQGPTPPSEYTLTPRERLFHGVAALRLNPVGGSATIHGRSGLLAHSYMGGPRGDSNGCVSIRDYASFLQAYRRGEIRRLVVVAGG